LHSSLEKAFSHAHTLTLTHSHSHSLAHTHHQPLQPAETILLCPIGLCDPPRELLCLFLVWM
jgi:hypothetical protein